MLVPRSRRAFTLVEILVVVVLLFMVIAMAAQTYFQSVSVEKSIGRKLDVLHQAQVVSIVISSELRQASELLYPPEGLDHTRPFMVFSNAYHHILVLYVNDQKELVLLDRNAADNTRILARGVTSMRVFRKNRRLVNYHLVFEDPTGQQRFDLISGMCVRNNFN